MVLRDSVMQSMCCLTFDRYCFGSCLQTLVDTQTKSIYILEGDHTLDRYLQRICAFIIAISNRCSCTMSIWWSKDARPMFYMPWIDTMSFRVRISCLLIHFSRILSSLISDIVIVWDLVTSFVRNFRTILYLDVSSVPGKALLSVLKALVLQFKPMPWCFLKHCIVSSTGVFGHSGVSICLHM